MSVQDPEQTVKSMFDRFATAGVQAAAALMHEDVVWTPHDLPDQTVRGREALLARFRRLAADGTRVEAVGHRFEDHGGCIVVVGRVRVLGTQGHYDVPMCWQVDVEDGLVTKVQAERHVEDARAECADDPTHKAA